MFVFISPAIAYVTKWMARVCLLDITQPPVHHTSPELQLMHSERESYPLRMYDKESIWNYSPAYSLHTECTQSLLHLYIYHTERTGGGKRITLSQNERMSEWKSEGVLYKEAARLGRGGGGVFICKQLPVRYFCCNGRKKMKHFSEKLIKGTLW